MDAKAMPNLSSRPQSRRPIGMDYLQHFLSGKFGPGKTLALQCQSTVISEMILTLLCGSGGKDQLEVPTCQGLPEPDES